MHAEVRIIIMAKAPVEGRVKTRLMTHYSAAQAAAIYRAMATSVIQRASRLFSDVWVATDDVQHTFFSLFPLPVFAQGEGDLGQRMVRLMQISFQQQDKPVMFLGCDSPHMPDARLLAAAHGLDMHDVVLGPVEDGGYELIALRACYPELFRDIYWSSERVLSQTLHRAARLGLDVLTLSPGFDIDTMEDLERSDFLSHELQTGGV